MSTNILDMVFDLTERESSQQVMDFCRNCIIFGVDMNSSVHVDNKKKDILILGEGPPQGLDGTELTAEKNIQLILLKITKNVDNKKKDILILGERPPQELDGTTLTAGKSFELILLKITKNFV